MKSLKRIEQLLEEAQEVNKTKVSRNDGWGIKSDVDDFKYEQWKQKVKNIIEITTGKESSYLQQFHKIDDMVFNLKQTYPRFNKHHALLSALKDDYENGYLTSIKNLIQAEVFDSEIEQAEELLNKKYKSAAAVIAGVVLETAIRSLCDQHAIEHGKLDKMNADLTKAGVYNKLQQKQITALAEIRNYAAHGKEEEYTHDNVENMIRDIEKFLANSF